MTGSGQDLLEAVVRASVCHTLLTEQHVNMSSCVCCHCLSIQPLVKYSLTFSDPVFAVDVLL